MDTEFTATQCARNEWHYWISKLEGIPSPWSSVAIGRDATLPAYGTIEHDPIRDEIHVFADGAKLYITGSNGRSVLYAVYAA